MKKGQEEKKSYVVTIRCTVRKSVTLEGCTLQQANDAPWDYAIDEYEIDQIDWEVESVRENE